jgi:signal transduction histidine kinase
MKHAALSGPADLSRRAGLGAAFAWVVSGFFLFAGVTQALAGNFAGALLDLFCVGVTAVSPFLTRRTGRLNLITHLVLALIYLGVIALSALVRGPGLSGATLMLAVLPLVATLVLGLRAGVVWVLLSSVTGITLGGLGVSGVIVDHLAGPLRLLNDHLVLLLFTVALFAMGAVFERRKDEALIQIFELEAQRRGAELEALRAQAEAQLAQAEQFASLGRIAAATAHEVNNPLAYLLANLGYVAANVKSVDDPDVHDALRDATEGAQRIQRIVSDMSAIARPADDVVSPVVVSGAPNLRAVDEHRLELERGGRHFDLEPGLGARVLHPLDVAIPVVGRAQHDAASRDGVVHAHAHGASASHGLWRRPSIDSVALRTGRHPADARTLSRCAQLLGRHRWSPFKW